ncbi:MAG: hypothetical protein CVT59_10535 [Actinobacteria bacterium HGW-Actinobacteria-1]|nr:MAG: hypothetical protein CVT59_10535 [Actinobacteria bacterium HGW-Actinobacteria-1]
MRPRDALTRALGNVFLGVAVGLLGYYGLTSILSWTEQARLRQELEHLGSVSASAPDDIDVSTHGPALDFTDWESQDKAYWDGLAEGDIFGRLVIERMDLDTIVVKGVGVADLKKGPGWVTSTALPGPSGNCGISGHRTTYLAPFRRIDQLVSGDVIDFYSPYRRYRYTVVRTFTVTPDKVEVFDPTEVPTLTLTACHPPYSARLRYIVQAEITEVRPLQQSGE